MRRGRTRHRPAKDVRRARPERDPAPGPGATTAGRSAPPRGREIWPWLAALSVLPLLLRAWGAPLGEPVAEDFDFLHRVWLRGNLWPFDGGGSQAFWRPIPHQLYYALLGNLIVGAPWIVAAIHTVVLAGATVLLFLALRTRWSGWWAFCAASFAAHAESSRTLLSWPTHFVDLGLYLFSALALFLVAHGRGRAALAALLGALLCKEVAVVLALLLPWLLATPGSDAKRRAARLRFAGAVAVVVGVWAVAYLAVRATAGLEMPHGLEHGSGAPGIPSWTKVSWAAWNSLRATMSLDLLPGSRDRAVGVAVGALVALAAAALAARPVARARLAGTGGWVAWGVAWFATASLTLTTIHPFWAPNRAQFGSVGLGVASTALLGSAHPVLPGLLMGIRLSAMTLAGGPSRSVALEPPDTGAFMDFTRLSRLQRLMAETRAALRRGYPRLPAGSRVCQRYIPLKTEYAFGGDRALQVWYRDTTLRMVSFHEFLRKPSMEIATIVEFQPHGEPPMALVDPPAMRRVIEATWHIARGQHREALEKLALAETLQRDGNAAVFQGTVAAKRSLSLLALGRHAEAEAQALAARSFWPEDPDSRYVVARLMIARGRLAEAEAQLDSMVAALPGHEVARALRDSVRAAAAASP